MLIKGTLTWFFKIIKIMKLSLGSGIFCFVNSLWWEWGDTVFCLNKTRLHLSLAEVYGWRSADRWSGWLCFGRRRRRWRRRWGSLGGGMRKGVGHREERRHCCCPGRRLRQRTELFMSLFPGSRLLLHHTKNSESRQGGQDKEGGLGK